MALRTAAPRLLARGVAAQHPHHRRTFISLPTADVQTLTATRTLPYAREPLYDLIADVDSYRHFVPYCSLSRVTQWSPPDEQGRRYPTVADLHVGWGGFNEVFTSQLRCVPGISVEAISGDTPGAPSSVFRSLITRWSLKPVTSTPDSALTEVNLSIRYQFANPLYAAVSAAVSDKVAGMMIEAFETRARQQLSSQSRII